MFNLKNTLRIAYLSLIFCLFIGCSKEPSLASKMLNQDNCVLMNKDKLKIIDGNIIRLPLKELMGEVFVIDSDTVRIIDDQNNAKIFKIKKQTYEGRSLLTVMQDSENIFFACGVQ